MDSLLVVKALSVGLSCVGLILPVSLLEAAPLAVAAAGGQPASTQRQPASDVELDSDGRLQGLVVDVDGVPVAGAAVVIQQPGRELARTNTDALGRFSVGRLHGGTYQLTVGRHGQLVRVWAADTAPPCAKKMTLIIVGDDVVRGQLPLENFFASDAIVIVGLVAAMITLPIAVHNSDRGGPASPP